MLGVSFNAENGQVSPEYLGAVVVVVVVLEFLSLDFKYKYAFIGMCLFVCGEVICLLSDFQRVHSSQSLRTIEKKKKRED